MGEEFLNDVLGLDMDGGAMVASSGPIAVRLCGLTLLSLLASRLVRRAVQKVDNVRTRRQLDFFAPKFVRVLVLAAGLEVAGVDVTDAVLTQLVVMYLVLGSVAVAAVTLITLIAARAFTADARVAAWTTRSESTPA